MIYPFLVLKFKIEHTHFYPVNITTVIKLSKDISVFCILRGNYLLKSYILVLLINVSKDLEYIS